MFALATASAIVPYCVLQISSASCSTHPACGNICLNSFWATLMIEPCLSNIILRLLVVPWSSARINCEAMQANFDVQEDKKNRGLKTGGVVKYFNNGLHGVIKKCKLSEG